MRYATGVVGVCLLPLHALGQTIVNRQQKFHRQIAPGNYSGITALGDNRYAVVNDKSPDGFHIFHILIDTISGRIHSVDDEGFRPSGGDNRDQEGIAWVADRQRLFISGERDNEIHEYLIDGTPVAAHPVAFAAKARSNRGLESLCYDDATRTLWTTTEEPLPGDSCVRIQSFDADVHPLRQYFYRADTPLHRKKRKSTVANGISELCATGDGRLLVLEREVYVPRRKIGASVNVRLYETRPATADTLQKRLLCTFTTRINITSRKFANYEGCCVAHRLADGRIILLLIGDSQNRFRGMLRDWFRTVIIDKQPE